MKRYLFSLAAVALVAALAMLALQPGNNTSAAGPPQVVSAFGVGNVGGEQAIVHVTVVVPAGQRARAVVEAALHAQGARPLRSADFSLTGLVWDQFFDNNSDNNSVTQNYNPADDPSGNGQTALRASQSTWSGVTGSTFAFSDGGTTTRCPSLVQECKGRQTFDGNNDVAWLQIKDRNTLGVTWYGTSTDEADMALSTRFSWSTTDAEAAGAFDVETVFLHENGHVVGLGHSEVSGAVMEAVYAGVRTTLHVDDIAGVQALYGPPNDAPSVTITSPAGGTTFASGATISFVGAASDAEDDDTTLTASIAWTSSIDGAIGTGGSFDTPLSDGVHTITASVTDSGGASASDSISITVGTPPPGPTAASADDISYSTSGGRNGDKHLGITVHVIDDLGSDVANASVSIDLFRDGGFVGSGTGTTGSDGDVTFTLSNARNGCYTTTVTSVSADSLTWDEASPANGFCK